MLKFELNSSTNSGLQRILLRQFARDAQTIAHPLYETSAKRVAKQHLAIVRLRSENQPFLTISFLINTEGLRIMDVAKWGGIIGYHQ